FLLLSFPSPPPLLPFFPLPLFSLLSPFLFFLSSPSPPPSSLLFSPFPSFFFLPLLFPPFPLFPLPFSLSFSLLFFPSSSP
ncbi:hypothetical protein ACXWR7_12435, partial [Streptococcus pyogenes]